MSKTAEQLFKKVLLFELKTGNKPTHVQLSGDTYATLKRDFHPYLSKPYCHQEGFRTVFGMKIILLSPKFSGEWLYVFRKKKNRSTLPA